MRLMILVSLYSLSQFVHLGHTHRRARLKPLISSAKQSGFYSKVQRILLKSATEFTQKWNEIYSKVQRILLKSIANFTQKLVECYFENVKVGFCSIHSESGTLYSWANLMHIFNHPSYMSLYLSNSGLKSFIIITISGDGF